MVGWQSILGPPSPDRLGKGRAIVPGAAAAARGNGTKPSAARGTYVKHFLSLYIHLLTKSVTLRSNEPCEHSIGIQVASRYLQPTAASSSSTFKTAAAAAPTARRAPNTTGCSRQTSSSSHHASVKPQQTSVSRPLVSSATRSLSVSTASRESIVPSNIRVRRQGGDAPISSSVVTSSTLTKPSNQTRRSSGPAVASTSTRARPRTAVPPTTSTEQRPSSAASPAVAPHAPSKQSTSTLDSSEQPIPPSCPLESTSSTSHTQPPTYASLATLLPSPSLSPDPTTEPLQAIALFLLLHLSSNTLSRSLDATLSGLDAMIAMGREDVEQAESALQGAVERDRLEREIEWLKTVSQVKVAHTLIPLVHRLVVSHREIETLANMAENTVPGEGGVSSYRTLQSIKRLLAECSE